MRTPSFLAESIRSWLHAHKVATLPELKQVLGTEVGMTVFRKLRELGPIIGTALGRGHREVWLLTGRRSRAGAAEGGSPVAAFPA